MNPTSGHAPTNTPPPTVPFTVSLSHTHGQPCPHNGKPTGKWFYTDRTRKGWRPGQFNMCKACATHNVPSLKQLNDRRARGGK